jgi:hypothetical protein
MRVLKSVRDWWRYRSALKAATFGEDPDAVARLLDEDPSAAERLGKDAARLYEDNAPWYSVLVCVGLVRKGAPPALGVVRRLLDHGADNTPLGAGPVPWRRLRGDHVGALLSLLTASGEPADVDRFLDKLSQTQLGSLPRPAPADAGYLAWLDSAVRRAELVPAIVEDLDAAVRNAAGPAARLRDPDSELLLNVCGAACLIVVRNSGVRPLLRTLHLLSILWPSAMTQGLVQQVAESLPRLPVEESVLAADILKRAPSVDWLPALQRKWVDIDDLLRKAPEYLRSDEERLTHRYEARAAAVVLAGVPETGDTGATREAC